MLTMSTLEDSIMDTTSSLDRSPACGGALRARMWRASPPLMVAGAAMTVAAAAALVGMLVDPRTITGAPAWLKPFKFGVSTAIYSVTLAWIFTYLPDRRRVRRWVGWTTAIVLPLE